MSDLGPHDIAVVLSGMLTTVPSPYRPSLGAQAARVLAMLYRESGNDALRCVDGDFCAAILDRRKGSISFVRDKLGIARAYLSRERDTVTFSDSLADLLDVEDRAFPVDVDSIHAFLMIGWVPTPHSMFQGVEKFPAGTVIESRNGALTESVYYDVPHDPSHTTSRSPTDLAHDVATHLDRSVSRGLSLGGRWGSFLSGGVDSSSVVSSMSLAGGSGFPTYFGGFDPQLNQYLPNPEEPEMSRLVATRFGTDHHMLWLGPEAVEMTAEIVGALEEPVCDGGCVVLGAVMNAARVENDGLMTGIGGDFLFTGERRHKVLALLQYMRPIPSPLWRLMIAATGVQPLARNARVSQVHFDLARLASLRNLDIAEMYSGFFSQAEPDDMQSLFAPSVYSNLTRDPCHEMNMFFEEAHEMDPLGQFLYLDLKTQTPEHCVREVETLGRHFGLLLFNPFLDSEFVDFAMGVPSSEKLSGLRLKIPLKNAMRQRVPDRVLDRKKGGLGSPIRWWVSQTSGFVADTLAGLGEREIFRADTIQRFRTATASGSADYSKLLWSLFTLELWFQHFVDGRAS